MHSEYLRKLFLRNDLAEGRHVAPYLGPDEWLKMARTVEGSWWPEWTHWLAARSGEPGAPPSMGGGSADAKTLPDAPGGLCPALIGKRRPPWKARLTIHLNPSRSVPPADAVRSISRA